MNNFIQGAMRNALSVQTNPAAHMMNAQRAVAASGDIALKLTSLIDQEERTRLQAIRDIENVRLEEAKQLETSKHNRATEQYRTDDLEFRRDEHEDDLGIKKKELEFNKNKLALDFGIATANIIQEENQQKLYGRNVAVGEEKNNINRGNLTLNQKKNKIDTIKAAIDIENNKPFSNKETIISPQTGAEIVNPLYSKEIKKRESKIDSLTKELRLIVGSVDKEEEETFKKIPDNGPRIQPSGSSLSTSTNAKAEDSSAITLQSGPDLLHVDKNMSEDGVKYMRNIQKYLNSDFVKTGTNKMNKTAGSDKDYNETDSNIKQVLSNYGLNLPSSASYSSVGLITAAESLAAISNKAALDLSGMPQSARIFKDDASTKSIVSKMDVATATDFISNLLINGYGEKHIDNLADGTVLSSSSIRNGKNKYKAISLDAENKPHSEILTILGVDVSEAIKGAEYIEKMARGGTLGGEIPLFGTDIDKQKVLSTMIDEFKQDGYSPYLNSALTHDSVYSGGWLRQAFMNDDKVKATTNNFLSKIGSDLHWDGFKKRFDDAKFPIDNRATIVNPVHDRKNRTRIRRSEQDVERKVFITSLLEEVSKLGVTGEDISRAYSNRKNDNEIIVGKNKKGQKIVFTKKEIEPIVFMIGASGLTKDELTGNFGSVKQFFKTAGELLIN